MARIITQPLYFCCEAVSRINADVNKLCEELRNAIQLEKSRTTLQNDYDWLLKELESKLETLAPFELENIDYNIQAFSEGCKVHQFVEFMGRLWHDVSDAVRNKSTKVKHISSYGIQTSTLVSTVSEFIDMVFSIYYQDFVHAKCSALFLHASDEITSYICPKLSEIDRTEGECCYLKWCLSFLVNLITLVDYYKYSSAGIQDVVSFFNSWLPGRTESSTTNILGHLEQDMDEFIEPLISVLAGNKYLELFNEVYNWLFDMSWNDKSNCCSITADEPMRLLTIRIQPSKLYSKHTPTISTFPRITTHRFGITDLEPIRMPSIINIKPIE